MLQGAAVLQCAVVCYSALRCVAVFCSVLQRVFVWVLACSRELSSCIAVCCSVLQGVAVYCSVLQCVFIWVLACSRVLSSCIWMSHFARMKDSYVNI